MKSAADIVVHIENRPDMLRLLRAVEQLALPDAWIGGGFIRNAVWDALHRHRDIAAPNDVDVLFFDRADLSEERETALEIALHAACPDIPWSVKNQARIHLANGDAAYADTADAMRHWPETATAIAARSAGGRIELLVPFGVDDLLRLVVRPTPAFAKKMLMYRRRQQQKRWQARWPQVRVGEMELLD